MLYHISKTPGLKVLKPQISTHKKAYVYAIENMVTGLLFGAPKDDFDFILCVQDGVPVVMECYPDAFRQIFEGRSCSVYEVCEDGFERGKTTWSAELVSENEVEVLSESVVENLYARLLEEKAKGNLIVRRYEDTEPYKHMISKHIVDRLIRFDMVYTDHERLHKHFGKLIAALRSTMDGHLL